LDYYSRGYEILCGGGRKSIHELLRIFEMEGVMTLPEVEITGLCGKFKIVGMCVNTKEVPGLADEC
jgi:hypothetical protein